MNGIPETFNSLEAFLSNEIAALEGGKATAKFSEKRAIEKRLKPLRSLLKKCQMVRGK